jgi:uncharacterized protein YehS (DUF1456 family)
VLREILNFLVFQRSGRSSEHFACARRRKIFEIIVLQKLSRASC